jgi:hypothetical protein
MDDYARNDDPWLMLGNPAFIQENKAHQFLPLY